MNVRPLHDRILVQRLEDKEEKSDKDLSKVPPQLRKHVKGKMDEAQIRNLIRKLVKEAMAKKETK